MANGVLERLLRDSKQLAVPTRVGRWLSIELELHVGHASLDTAQHLDVLPQGGREPVSLELGRAQLEDEVAQLLERLLRQLPQAVDLNAGRVFVDTEQRVGRLRRQREREQLLADHVVQLEGEAVALVEDRELAASSRRDERW